ncbi:MAG TPA: hypothetical protein VF815_33685 [Myxococcaceae bacterium]|jgi:hypothetical protein
MGGALKTLGKIANFVKPFVSMVNPLLGAAIGFAGDLAQGKNPLKSLLSAATDFIPGSGVLKNVMGKWGGSGFLDGAGGNSLLSGALDLVTGKKKVTDVLKDVVGGVAKNVTGGLTDLGMENAAELAARKMASGLLQ